MITAVVTFTLPPGTTREQWRANTDRAAPGFLNTPNLIRKTFLYRDGVGGGIYTWADRASAEAFHAGPWRDNLIRLYGSEPQVVFYESPVIVEAAQGRLETAEPETALA